MNDEIKMIPIDRIRILNPRYRDRKKFEAIVQSIKNLGLKKPIQLPRTQGGPHGKSIHAVICRGSGRDCVSDLAQWGLRREGGLDQHRELRLATRSLEIDDQPSGHRTDQLDAVIHFD